MTPTVRVWRNPRDGAGYIPCDRIPGDMLLVTDTTQALLHYKVGVPVAGHAVNSGTYGYREPELQPWDDCPAGVLVPHEQVCVACRQQVAS